ncbi:TPA: CidA/LrgA family protein [Streptococcus suis]|nr:CidA/LrgA family protein [Streptococcus suis]
MKLYVQFMIILIFSFLGEAISSLFHLPIPGSIIGLILLFLALEFKVIRLRHINTVGNFLLANMTILFLPAAVGIMERFDAIKSFLLPIVLIILGAIFLNTLVIGLVVQFVKRQFEGDYVDIEVKHD